MKLLFILQTLRRVPLGYDFRLYLYGPFDAQVLDDLGYAERLGIVTSELVAYPNGWGYILQAGPKISEWQENASDILSPYKKPIEEVVEEFGSRSALDLEMIGTILYVAQELARGGSKPALNEVAERVYVIKPHLKKEVLLSEMKKLTQKNYLDILT